MRSHNAGRDAVTIGRQSLHDVGLVGQALIYIIDARY